MLIRCIVRGLMIPLAIPAAAFAQSDTFTARAVADSSLAMFKAPRTYMRLKGIVPPSSEPRSPAPAAKPEAKPEQDPAHPAVGMVDTPTVTILRGMTVPAFEAEMQLMNQALGVSCNHCHVRANFASEDNPRKAVARKMLEMTRTINQQSFPAYRPADGESRLGKVTCFTCHQGLERPRQPADRPQ